tara:strand:+ start:2520 stop:2762 length:243 start_codon:yes stop_codon:yes gene_type:complete
MELDGKNLVIHATQVAAFFAGKVFLVHCRKLVRQLVYLLTELVVFFEFECHRINLQTKVAKARQLVNAWRLLMVALPENH